MRFLKLKPLVLTICIFSLIINIANAKKKSEINISELRGWIYEDQVFSDDSVNNIDIVKLNNGDLRAYYMDFGNVLSAISSDNGKTFTFEEGIRIAGQHHALVKLDDGRIRIYFSSNDDRNLRSAISEDGLTFIEEEGFRLTLGAEGEPDVAGIIHPVIVKTPSDGFKIYYDALDNEGIFPNDSQGIMSASSDDGLNFTKDQGFRIRSGTKPLSFSTLVWSPFVEYDDGLYKLYFSVEGNAKKAGAYVGVSEDGINFTISKKPILKRDKRLGPNKPGIGGLPGLPQDIFIIEVDGGKRLYYWSAGGHGIYSAFNDLED